MSKQKELKEQYKLKKLKIGVFQIKNTANEKVYVDSSTNLEAIWNRNRMELNFGNHRNETLQKDWKEYGEEAFRFEILSEIEQRDNEQIDYAKEAKQLADMFIDELKPFADRGYNTRKA